MSDAYQDAIEQTREDMADRDYESERKHHRMQICRIPLLYEDVSLGFVPDDATYREKIVTWQKRFLEAAQAAKRYPGLYLHGPAGSGKSALAAGIATFMSGKGMGTLWLNYGELFDVAKHDPAWVDKVDEGMWSFAQRCHLLVIDDANQAVSRGNTYTDLVDAKFEELVRTRVARGLTTIITSNFTLDNLRESGREVLADVIDESSYTLEINAMNFRYLRRRRRDRKEPL